MKDSGKDDMKIKIKWNGEGPFPEEEEEITNVSHIIWNPKDEIFYKQDDGRAGDWLPWTWMETMEITPE